MWFIVKKIELFSGEAARKEAAQRAEVVAETEAVMAAMEAESKKEVVSEPSAVSQVLNKLLLQNYSKIL